MKEQKGIYKYLFLGLIIVFGVLTVYAIKATETPRLVLFLGRFHPLLLHLPIGALVVTFFIDLLGRFQKKYATETVKNLLGFTAFFAIATCFLGYFLSLEGGYLEETLDLHFYTGIATAVLATGLFALSLKPSYNSNKLFLLFFVVTLILISVAGHYGSVLTHGETFLTEYAKAPEKEKTIEVVDSLKLYNDVVYKILDNKCIQCHNASKQKGELSMLTPQLLLKGGVNGPSVVAGNAQSSLMYTRALLPISDDEHMPPEGKEQLTKDELWLIKHWIDNGANATDYVQNVAANDTLSRKLEKYLIFNKIEIPKASKSDIDEVVEAGFRVTEIVPREAELSVKYLNKTPSKESIEVLSEIKEQVIELDFHALEITDEMTSVLKQLKNLKTLKINSPQITDQTLENLEKLEQLEVLNLYNTGITNDGLSELLKSIQPKKIYAWFTKVDKETARQLAAEYNISIENSITEGFVEESRLELPLVTPKRTLFTDTIHVGLKSRLKDVALRYTLDGKEPDETSELYTEKLILNSSKTLKVKAFKADWLPSETMTEDYARITHRVTSYTLKQAPDERYPDGDKLFDLNEATLAFGEGDWVGYFGNDLEATIDLGAVKTVNNISMRCLENVGSWILYPKQFTVYASVTKNGNFRKVGDVAITRSGQGGGDPEAKKITASIAKTNARYFKIKIKNFKTLPKWHPSAGNPSWLFVDEIYFW